MTRNNISTNLQLDDYKQEGLYLHFEDSSRLFLTNEVIEQTANKFWQDPTKIPSEIKEAEEFQRCSICPGRDQVGLCTGIAPVLPFLEYADKYVSFDRVTAIYRERGQEVLYVSTTTMQIALSYIAILSLLRYCLNSREYWQYYLGVVPFSSAETTAARIYLNIYWLHKGNKEEIDKAVSQFQEELMITTKNQIERLSLICKNDAFINAFARAQMTTEFLSMDIDSILKDQIGKHSL